MRFNRKIKRRGFTLAILATLTIQPLHLSILAQGGPGKKPISHESMWLMTRVGAPVPSPDGKWVVFSVTEPAYDDKDQATDLWIASTDGKNHPRRLPSAP